MTFRGPATPIDDHGAGLKEAVALATRLGVKPEKNDTSKRLQQQFASK